MESSLGLKGQESRLSGIPLEWTLGEVFALAAYAGVKSVTSTLEKDGTTIHTRAILQKLGEMILDMARKEGD